ncbi:MAG: type II/IV secretion system protein [Candidatus Pacebacteria bacterium]|nr:type II/IV secretion system protein [Candidatus Paceibacterota bacterium]
MPTDATAIAAKARVDAGITYETPDEHEVPTRELGSEKIPYSVLKYIPQESALHYKVVPLSLTDGVLDVGMVDPENLSAVDALNFITRKTGTPFKIFQISDKDFEKVKLMYKGLGGDVDQALTDLHSEGSSAPAEDEGGANESLDLNEKVATPSLSGAGAIQEDAPAIKLVSTILRYAIDGNASDIHIEPTSNGVRVRYRVDGILHTSVVLPLETHRSLVARVKVLSSIRLDEKRKPQDGRFSASIEGRKIDFRVSTFPSYNGEKVVIRILDREEGFVSLDKLGLSTANIALIREAVRRPHGLVLISGPTGSGKSTTLYSMLAEVDREQKNVLSLEDPVEYYMEGVTQSQVRPEIGYTFANGLRTTLRQDPDVIMVGEIRDGETAKLAIQAALTGHLVLSTIHTNSAVGTIPRLIDMGVEPYLIPPVLILSIAQRLVRTLCPGAEKPVPVTDSMRHLMELEFSTLPEHLRPKIPDMVVEAQRTASCPTGMRGRMAVLELMQMTPKIENVILKEPVESRIWAEARKEGMLTMKEDAFLKVFDGKVPYSEASALSALSLESEEVVASPVVVDAADTGVAPTPAPAADTVIETLDSEKGTTIAL